MYINTNVDSTDNGAARQCQVSTDCGTSFTDILDGPEYCATTTKTLTAIQPEMDKNGYLCRVIITRDPLSVEAKP